MKQTEGTCTAEKKTRRPDVLTLVRCGICTAVITVCSWISIPSAIPFTLQTFAVCLVSSVFGPGTGIMSLVLYVLLGAFGFPVFSGFRAGAAVLFGVTGGYILGFFATAALSGYLPARFGRSIGVLMLSMALGITACYAFGTAWCTLVYMRTAGPVSLGAALSWCVIPYIPADAAKIAAAALISKRIYPMVGRHTK